MRRAWLVIPFVVLAVVLLAWSQTRTGPYYVSGFIEADQVRVGSRVGGRVVEVLVEEGQRVQPGDLLIRLDAFDLEARRAEAEAQRAAAEATLQKLRAGYRPQEIAQARAALQRRQATLDKLIAGPRPLEIDILQAKLDAAEAQLTRAQIEYDRVKALFEKGQAAQEEWDDVVKLLEQARAEFAAARDELALAREGTRAEEIAEARAAVAEAEAALALLEAGYREEEIAEAEAQVAALRAALAAIDRRVEELAVRSPCPCVVEAMELEPGDLAPAGAPVISLIEPGDLWVRAYVPENRLDLSIDQRVAVRVDAFPDRRFGGQITFIARDAEFTPSNIQTPEERSKQVFRIKVALEEGEDVLRPGMGADVFLEPPA